MIIASVIIRTNLICIVNNKNHFKNSIKYQNIEIGRSVLVDQWVISTQCPISNRDSTAYE